MTSSDELPAAFHEVAAAFAEYLDRIESGEELSFDEFCATKHEAVRSHLMRVFDDWQRIETVRGADTPGSSTFVEILRARRDEVGDARSLEGDGAGGDATGAAWDALVARLGDSDRERDRYLEEGEVARGGMGAVLKVWDRHLRRALAKKVLLSRDEQGKGPDRDAEERALGRFLEEAQVSAQLEHPGIVPVHELGVDRDGKIYFTMQLVEGRHLGEIFDDVAGGSGGWNLTRAVGVILRVCEATAFAHSKGVVHRDLKPSNVMVGRFGETFVMDWGLARVMGRGEGADGDAFDPDGTTRVMTERQQRGEEEPGTPLKTMVGDVIGTPAYMSPEQAHGETDRVGPASDVYAVGAILYQLLAGRMPYDEPGRASTPREVWNQVKAGPPAPLERVVRDIPPPLVAVCERAMARRPVDRYPTMEAMADDLRAYLENRVVQAYRTGPVAEFSSWVRRNRHFAASLAVLVVVVLGAGSLYALAQRDAALTARDLAEERASGAAAELIARAEASWPIHPDHAEEMDAWIASAEGLVASLPPDLDADLASLREQARPRTAQDVRAEQEGSPARFELRRVERMIDEFERQLGFAREIDAAARAPGWERGWAGKVLAIRGPSADRTPEEYLALLPRRSDADYWFEWAARALAQLPTAVAGLVDRRDALQRQLDTRRTWRFRDDALQREHDALQRLTGYVRRLDDPDAGLITSVSARKARALSLVGESVDGHRVAWAEAIASIGDPAECPLYEGLALERQIGLVPLGRDPASGLWEFHHVLSGEAPTPREGGGWVMGSRTGLVLVLVPGGPARMGAQDDPARPFHDPWSAAVERPVQDVGALRPYFLSKFEMTQAQWLRLAGENPSAGYAARDPLWGTRITDVHPVENVSWETAREQLSLWNLELPTEAQWERAARAGGDSVWWWGDDFLAGVGGVNGHDRAFERARDQGEPILGWDDGWPLHAPVDSMRPNAWGLHHVTGNVAEWCADWYGLFSDSRFAEDGTGRIEPAYARARSHRGGGYGDDPAVLRVAARNSLNADQRTHQIGIRPLRRVDG